MFSWKFFDKPTYFCAVSPGKFRTYKFLSLENIFILEKTGISWYYLTMDFETGLAGEIRSFKII